MSNPSDSLSQLALRKFKKNFWGVFSFWLIVVIGLLSLFAYVVAPDDSQNANEMHLKYKIPVFYFLISHHALINNRAIQEGRCFPSIRARRYEGN